MNDSRRLFLKGTAAGGLGLTLAGAGLSMSRLAFAQAPSLKWASLAPGFTILITEYIVAKGLDKKHGINLGKPTAYTSVSTYYNDFVAGQYDVCIDMFQPYDDFTIAVLMQFEAFGFCGKGEGSAFTLRTDLSHTGELPLNTGGGQISAGQPGLASGGLNLAEAVRQLFGEGGARQVADARNALVTGIGVIPYAKNWGTSSAMILEV